MDFEKMIRDATGLPTADTVFTKPQKLPFAIFLNKPTTDGDDFNTRIIEHDLAVELYAERIDREHEQMLEDLFESQNWKWSRGREWLSDQRCFITVYEIEKFYEKYRKET